MGKFLITMGNAENKNCATLTLDEAFKNFELSRQARNLSEESIGEYRKNYKYFCELLNHLDKHFRRSNKHMRPSLF